jgi:Flp pilus assembly protein TadD
VLIALGISRTGVADAGPMSGMSGAVRWQVVDVIQTLLPEAQALRWDFAVVLTANRGIRFERFEVAVGGSTRSHPWGRRLDAGGEVRAQHWERSRAGNQSTVARRWYHGTDDAGNPVTVEVWVELDGTVGRRPVPASAVSVTSPIAGVPLPTDARIVPPAAVIAPGLARFSGLWTGKWGGWGTDHVLVVEEVGARHMLITYAWGQNPTGREPREAGWVRSRAQITETRLTAELGGTTSVTYAAQEDGRLYGLWTRGAETSTVRLVRQPVTPASGATASATPEARAALLARGAWQDLLDGRYADALPKAQQALALREQALGSDHLDVAASLSTLGEIYRAHGRFDDAERVHRRALAIREHRLGAGHPDVATTLNNLAMLHNARAVYAEAESLLKRALGIVQQARETPLENRRVEAEVLENLAKVYRALGRIAEAEEAQTKAMLLWVTQ